VKSRDRNLIAIDETSKEGIKLHVFVAKVGQSFHMTIKISTRNIVQSEMNVRNEKRGRERERERERYLSGLSF
jgi:hypothetical protein